jgi:hypothetical protein
MAIRLSCVVIMAVCLARDEITVEQKPLTIHILRQLNDRYLGGGFENAKS